VEDVHCTLKDIKIHQRSGPFLTHLALAFSSWAYVVSIKILTHDDIYKYKILLVCHLNVKYKYFFLGNWGTRGWEDCWNDIESIWTGRVASSMWRTQRKRRKMEAKNAGPAKNVSRSGKICTVHVKVLGLHGQKYRYNIFFHVSLVNSILHM
jgi:hypothetical protein